MGRLVEVTTPVGYPVTIDEARTQCALYDDTTHDVLLSRLIGAATKEVEGYTGSTIVSRTMRLDMDGFQTRDIELQTYPVQSITYIKYDDGDDAEQTVTSSDYYTDIEGMNPRIRAANYWPATLTDKLSSARVTFVAGYDTDEIPEDLKQAILLRVYEMWSDPSTVASTDKTLAVPHRRFN